jgi:hypothetical protein
MLSKIRLELARTHEFPEGNRSIGYEFTAPLRDGGTIDPGAWHSLRGKCRVRRFRLDEDDDIGHLVRRPGGSWAFHYDVRSDDGEDDESGFRFGEHAFKPGEYVSIKEDDELVTYKVAFVRPVET